VTALETLIHDDSAQGMTEYAILIGTLALGAVVTLLAVGTRLRQVFSNVQTQLNSVPTS
jgi:Flp pilus assembly pilin Flp